MAVSNGYPHASDGPHTSDSRGGPISTTALRLAEPWARSSLVVTFAFHCNLACEFCMVEDVLNVIEGTSLEAFQEAVRDPARLDGKSRLIFSGGEVTLAKNLREYVAAACAVPGIKHVRIQTNAVRLADREYLRSLIDAGVDEYFVSFHAPDAALSDELTQRPGSFKDIVAGMENVVAEGATLVTNTVMVSNNYRRLPEIADLIASVGPRSMEFCNYWPRSDEDCARDQAPQVAAVQPYLLEAVRRSEAAGIPPVIRWFPRCLLGAAARYADDYQPGVLIPDWFWDREPEYGCLYEGLCSEAADARDPCLGLSHAYVRRYGWEEKLLSPQRAPVANSNPEPRRPSGQDRAAQGERVAMWLDAHGLAVGASLGQRGQFTLVSAEPSPHEALVLAEVEHRTESFEIRIHPHDPESPAFIRTAGLNISYGKTAPGRSQMAQAAARALATALSQRRDPSALFDVPATANGRPRATNDQRPRPAKKRRKWPNGPVF